MPRRSVESKIIDGKKYYTSAYFTGETGMDSRSARKFLEDFQGLEGHTNPRLYDEKTMEKAINACMNDSRAQILREEKSKNMAEKEEDHWERILLGETNGDEFLEQFRREVESDSYKLDMLIVMLKHLLFLQGYEFDTELYKADLESNLITESVIQPGELRSDDAIKILERLKSNNAYLVRK